MTFEIDPEGEETRRIRGAVRLAGARVLEIGCGDGRLSFRYAHEPSSVTAIDREVPELRRAVSRCTPDQRRRLRFVAASAAPLPFGAARFDVVLFARSL